MTPVPDAAAPHGSPRVAVIGGGWAGCAAAVRLADAGVHVTLYEQSGALGGRARTVMVDGIACDNGQHLLLGAYRSTLALIDRLHGHAARSQLLRALPLTLRSFGTLAASTPSFVAGSLPAPLHLASAIVLARRLSLRDRWTVVRDFRRMLAAAPLCREDEPVAMRLADTTRAVFGALWEPLCLAALNTPPQRASAKVFANVLRVAFTGPASASEFLVARTPLGEVLPEPAGAAVLARGGEVHLGTRVRSVVEHEGGVDIMATQGSGRFDAVIVATGPHQIRHLDVREPTGAWDALRTQVAAFAYESITTIYLAYDAVDMPAPLARLDDQPGQWIFDRGIIALEGAPARLVAVVISASGPHDALHQSTLSAMVDAQLRRLAPSLPPPRHSRVVAERRATYACTPGLARPVAGALTPRIHLAGDYAHPDFPATLESAVATGECAAATASRAVAWQRT